MLYKIAARLSGKVPNLMEFGHRPGGVENNKDRPSECSIKEVNIFTVNECELESACWCEYLIIDY